jgi:uncharacterized MAPEG superfamily protein
MDFLTTHNLSILSIPAYYVLSLLPHAYAIAIGSRGNPVKWDNRNPRGASQKAHLKSTLSPAAFSKFERAEAAHANALENVPMFASAVIIGNVAGLQQEGLHGLNGFAGLWLGLRAAHTLSYVLIDDKRASYIRTALWVASIGLCFRVFGEAAKALGGKVA